VDELLKAIAGGVVAGLIAWGGIGVKLAWMRRDLDDHHRRLTYIERHLGGRRRFTPDDPDQCET
jgi:hypothetical protein